MPRISGALVALLLAALVVPSPASAGELDVLPDLDQAVPAGLTVKTLTIRGRTVHRLGFDSASANVGAGPLTLHGHRATRRDPTMDVDQLVKQSVGPARVVRGVGVMSYVVHPDHDHWHLLGFERYEIRSAGDRDGPPLARDRKTGFCLGDRYPVPNADALAAYSPLARLDDTCGPGKPGLLGLFAGISVGYGDRYAAHIEGQHIDITDVPAGRYELVHTLNTNGRLVELDPTNNAASVLFALTRGPSADVTPRVRVLRRCPDSPTCTT